MIAIDFDERYTPAEMVTPDTVRLMRWFLETQCASGLIRLALAKDWDLDDLVQEICMYLCRYPGRRAFAVTTIVCKKARQVAILRARRNGFRHKTMPQRKLLDDGSDITARETDGFEWTDEVPFIANDLKRLHVKEQFVLRARFGFDGPKAKLTTIGEVLGITKERVRQIETSALDRLRLHVELRMQNRYAAGIRRVQARRMESTKGTACNR